MERVLTDWYHRVKESYVAVWVYRVFQTTGRMSSSASTCGGSASGGSGALSLMGCVREASPPPQDHGGMGEVGGQRGADTLPKEPKKRRFHPLRGLRRIFRRKSRGAADARINSRNGERDGDLPTRDREEVTLRHPAGVPEEARSRSASELLTDSCDRQSVFLRRSGIDESFAKLRAGSGQLSVSHDSVFPGEVPHTRPLSSLDTLATLERRQTKASAEAVHKDYGSYGPYNHRISPRVLEQIKTAIESRNQLASSTSPESTHAPNATGERYQQETNENRFTRSEKRDRIEEEPAKFRVTRTQQDVVERITATPKEDLPELESASLSHTAAHHRIAIRPKNRRPPRRPTPSSSSTVTVISESSDTLDSLEPIMSSPGSSPVAPKAPSILRKSSSRLSRNCELFEELESKLPRKPASVASLSPDSLDSTAKTILDNSEAEEPQERKAVVRRPSSRVSKGSDVFEELESRLPRRRSISRLSKSPDSLENSFSKSSEGFDKLTEHEEVKPAARRLQTSISKSTEGFDMISEAVEVRPMPRRLPTAISKSTEGFDKLMEHDEPRPVARRLLLPMSKSSDVVSKSSDSLEVLEALTSDDSIERRRSSFEMRPRRGVKVMSMSSENFEALEQVQEQKRNSACDVSLSRGKRQCKIISKSSESFEAMETSLEGNRGGLELGKYGWRSGKRVSSESSDNFEGEERCERKSRRPKRVSSSTVIDIFPGEGLGEEEKDFRRKARVQKSSESSELGSTDTLDSERRNKSDSTETLDSLEKDGEQEGRDEDMGDDDKRDKHDSWIKPESEPTNAVTTTPEEPKTPEKSYWRQTSESKENIDIHQLLALTIVSRISDNGNNQRNSAQFPKKKLASPPTSPIKQEDNKLLFNSLLSNKNDEDLQNMLNGNISEVSTDTKSFKEKLIMFEKLGK
ncbi:titin isoform X2 [Diachasma alloeum]|uniref:titin isoform X2 n=1 Tax=Diachasma alloeum TaxID=454923 RepID=UPI0007384959|nr:titin isoform X2 [Diachasma alloeum]